MKENRHGNGIKVARKNSITSTQNIGLDDTAPSGLIR